MVGVGCLFVFLLMDLSKEILQMLPIVGVEFRPDPGGLWELLVDILSRGLTRIFSPKRDAFGYASLHQRGGERGALRKEQSRFICHQKN